MQSPIARRRRAVVSRRDAPARLRAPTRRPCAVAWGGAPGAGGSEERAGYTTAVAFREQPSGNLGRLAKQHLPFILVASQRAAIWLDEFRISRLQIDRCTFASPIPSWIGAVVRWHAAGG